MKRLIGVGADRADVTGEVKNTNSIVIGVYVGPR